MLSFRVKPFPHSRYYAKVYICKTKPELFRIACSLGDKDDGNMVGVAIPTNNFTHPCIARVALLLDKIGAGYVAHELHHVKDYYLDRRYATKRLQFQEGYYDGGFYSAPFEVAAYAMGNLVSDFWTKFYKYYNVVNGKAVKK